MKEGTKRSIYHELATHDVVKTKENHANTDLFSHMSYTFGQYRVNEHFDYINICKLNPANNIFVFMNDADWDDDFPKNTTYEICVAAKNKANGQPYIDPYKIPAKEAIKDSLERFAKQMAEYAGDFLPYDMTKYQASRTIAEMKQVLIKNLNAHYNGKKR